MCRPRCRRGGSTRAADFAACRRSAFLPSRVKFEPRHAMRGCSVQRWSLSLGRWAGIHVRVHIFLLLFAVLSLAYMPADMYWRRVSDARRGAWELAACTKRPTRWRRSASAAKSTR